MTMAFTIYVYKHTQTHITWLTIWYTLSLLLSFWSPPYLQITILLPSCLLTGHFIWFPFFLQTRSFLFLENKLTCCSRVCNIHLWLFQIHLHLYCFIGLIGRFSWLRNKASFHPTNTNAYSACISGNVLCEWEVRILWILW